MYVTVTYLSHICHMTLRNIEELQQQNQRLLAVVRELSDQREEQEKETLDEHTKVRQRLSLSLLFSYKPTSKHGT